MITLIRQGGDGSHTKYKVKRAEAAGHDEKGRVVSIVVHTTNFGAVLISKVDTPDLWKQLQKSGLAVGDKKPLPAWQSRQEAWAERPIGDQLDTILGAFDALQKQGIELPSDMVDLLAFRRSVKVKNPNPKRKKT